MSRLIGAIWLLAVSFTAVTTSFAQSFIPFTPDDFGDRWFRQSNNMSKSADTLGVKLTVPPDVLAAVKAAPALGGDTVIDEKRINQQIYKVRWLSINPQSTLILEKMDVPWIAIVVDELSIIDPVTPARAATIRRPLENLFLVDGAPGAAHAGTAPYPPEESGLDGNKGATGQSGGNGKTVSLPTLYIFLNKTRMSNTTNPSPVRLRIDYTGIRGGNGGVGGGGQNGSPGARGTKSECNNLPPWLGGGCTQCRAGPGAGGKGGAAGSGGRGGNASNGGNGGDIFVVGPHDAQVFASLFLVDQRKALRGQPGAGGPPGARGSGGGGGYQCKCCGAGGGIGSSGDYANPPTLGPGTPASLDGSDGARLYEERANTDIF